MRSKTRLDRLEKQTQDNGEKLIYVVSFDPADQTYHYGNGEKTANLEEIRHRLGSPLIIMDS